LEMQLFSDIWERQ